MPGGASGTPARWPKDLTYLRDMAYSPSIPPSVLSLIRDGGKQAGSGMRNASANPLVVIRRIESHTHPASGQAGLFASKKIPPHTRIVDYLGEVHSDERLNSDYDLSLFRSHDGSVSVGIDASCMGNEARFVNDYRGIRPKPNAMFKDGRTAREELVMSIWSMNDVINKGEEILVSYGKSWWRARTQE